MKIIRRILAHDAARACQILIGLAIACAVAEQLCAVTGAGLIA